MVGGRAWHQLPPRVVAGEPLGAVAHSPIASARRCRLPGHARVAAGASVVPPSCISSAASAPSARASPAH
jgi:hypothetical protein